MQTKPTILIVGDKYEQPISSGSGKIQTKMKNLFLLFSHQLTESQKLDAKQRLNVTQFMSLPPDLQRVWSNVPPHPDLVMKEYLKPIFEYLANTAQNLDFVLVQGDFGATFQTVTLCKNIGLIPIYATTERRGIEKINPDGTVITQRIFEHVCFRKY